MQHSDDVTPADPRRRQLMVAGSVAAAATSLPLLVTTAHAAAARHHPTRKRSENMNSITTKDGTEIFYKDWGSGQPIVFHHGWPLSSDD